MCMLGFGQIDKQRLFRRSYVWVLPLPTQNKSSCQHYLFDVWSISDKPGGTLLPRNRPLSMQPFEGWGWHAGWGRDYWSPSECLISAMGGFYNSSTRKPVKPLNPRQHKPCSAQLLDGPRGGDARRSGGLCVHFFIAQGFSLYLRLWKGAEDTHGLLKSHAYSVWPDWQAEILQEGPMFWAFSTLNIDLLEMEQLLLSVWQSTLHCLLTPDAFSHCLPLDLGWPPEFCPHIQTRTVNTWVTQHLPEYVIHRAPEFHLLFQ